MAKSIKILFRNEIRRVSLQDKDISFDGVKKLAKTLYPTALEPLRFRYQDDEGDTVTVATDDDFQEAFRIATEKEANLRFTLVETEAELPACDWGFLADHFKGFPCGNRRAPVGPRGPRGSPCGPNAGGFLFKLVPVVLLFFLAKCLFTGRCCFLFPAILIGATFLFGRKIKSLFLRRRCQNAQWRCSQWFADVEPQPSVRVPKKEEKEEKEEEIVDSSDNNPDEIREERKPSNYSFANNLRQLEDMGFIDREKNIAILVKTKGNVVEAVRDLLG